MTTTDNLLAIFSRLRPNVRKGSWVSLAAYPYVVLIGCQSDILVMMPSKDQNSCEVVAHITDLPSAPRYICPLLAEGRLRLVVGCEGGTIIVMDFGERASHWKVVQRLNAPAEIAAIAIVPNTILVASEATLWSFSGSDLKKEFQTRNGEVITQVESTEDGSAVLLLRQGGGLRLAMAPAGSGMSVSYGPPFPPGTTVHRIVSQGQARRITKVLCLVTTSRGATVFECGFHADAARAPKLRPVAYLESRSDINSTLLLTNQNPELILALLWTSDEVRIRARLSNSKNDEMRACISMEGDKADRGDKRGVDDTQREDFRTDIAPLGVGYDEALRSPVLLLLVYPKIQPSTPSIVTVILNALHKETSSITTATTKSSPVEVHVSAHNHHVSSARYNASDEQADMPAQARDGPWQDWRLWSQFSSSWRNITKEGNQTSHKEVSPHDNPRPKDACPHLGHWLGTSRLEESPLDPWHNHLASPYRTIEHSRRSQNYRRNILQRAKLSRCRPELADLTNEQKQLLNEPMDLPRRSLSYGTIYTMSRMEKEEFFKKIIAPVPNPSKSFHKKIARIRIKSCTGKLEHWLVGQKLAAGAYEAAGKVELPA
ncbi:hypothetical protein FOL47_008365 [Perkinsus chesapeaki]|uniref:Uncharacterized protein n=1 Tax=Perkinsus chesapeaki TaxID=330153 RepID=A0A7J6LFA8_PERCH|nr:hypothetical protein FOL47_008365 [Perkinsus chesapeaki]